MSPPSVLLFAAAAAVCDDPTAAAAPAPANVPPTASRTARSGGGARYRLKFVYLVALGSVGTCRVRILQYQDHKNTWKLLAEGTVDRRLTVVGRWQAVVIDFRAEPGATTAAVIFDLESPCEVGECWVDSASLAPAGEPILVGP